MNRYAVILSASFSFVRTVGSILVAPCIVVALIKIIFHYKTFLLARDESFFVCTHEIQTDLDVARIV